MRKMELALIPLMLLLCSVVLTTTASGEVEKTAIEWLLVFEPETSVVQRFIGENILWQRQDQAGNVYDGGGQIGTITMQVKLLIDMTSNKGHANVKFVIELDGEEEPIKCVMNGKIIHVIVNDPPELEQYIDGRFAGNGAYHIHGTIVNQDPPEAATALLIGDAW